MEYKIDFKYLPCDLPYKGIIEKSLETSLMKVRKARFLFNNITGFCERPHFGLVINGSVEIEFQDRSIVFNKADAIAIPGGMKHKHRLIKTEYAELFLLEFTVNISVLCSYQQGQERKMIMKN